MRRAHAAITGIKPAQPPHEPSLTLYLEPQPGWSEDRIEAFYKQGYALEDPRDMKGLSDAYVESKMDKALTTLVEAGVQTIQSLSGDEAKVLWAPVLDVINDCPALVSSDDTSAKPKTAYGMVYLEGKDKGCWLHYPEYSDPSELPVFKDGNTTEAEGAKMGDAVSVEVKGETPKAGKMYAVWLPGIRKMLKPFPVRSVEKSGEVTKINFKGGTSQRLIVNSGIEDSTAEDLRGDGQVPATCGKDAVFIPVEADIEYDTAAPKTPEHIMWATATAPSNILPVTVGRVDECMLKTKTAAVTLIPVGRRRVDVVVNGRRRAEDLSVPELAFKLAGAS